MITRAPSGETLAYAQFSRIPLEDWLNGYRKSCKSEFEQLMDCVQGQIRFIKIKREIKSPN